MWQARKVRPEDLEIIRDNHALKHYLEGLDVGRPGTPHSWLYEHEDAQVTFQKWLKILRRVMGKSLFGEIFLQFDERQMEKSGQQGCVPPITDPKALEVIEPLYAHSEYDDEMALSQYFHETRRFAQFLFGSQFGCMQPKELRDVVDDMRERDTLSTNSGFPRFRERDAVVESEVSDANTEKAYTYPAIILFRQYNGKLRPVWMFSMSMNLIEGSFSQVIQASIRARSSLWVKEYTAPWTGFEDVKRVLTSMWPHPSPIVGGDTTKMDANMRQAQIRLVYEIVKWLFKPVYWPKLYKSMMHVNKIPLLIGVDTYLEGLHGLASGSGWTQLVETVLQMFMAWRRGWRGIGIGDDFTWLASLTAQELVAYLALFGLPANETKQDVGTVSLTFLQRMFHQGYYSRESRAVLGGYYPTIRALNSSLWPEKFHKPKLWNSDMFCTRQFMILENCVDDIAFDEFVRFVVQGHRDLVPFAKKSAEELSRIQKAARMVPGLNPSYNQEKREKPLSDFESIKLARKL